MDREALGIHASSLPTIAISRGRKKQGGGVEGKDRLWLTNARAVGSGRNAYRELAPDFAAYNDEPTQPHKGESLDDFRARVADHHASRRILHATIMHSRFEAEERGDLDGAVYSRFQAQTMADRFPERVRDAKPPPGQAPWCTGNGRLARRWDGAKWLSVPCPGDKCEWRQEGTGARGQGKHSQKTSTLVVQLRWPMAPCPACKGRCIAGPDRAPCAVCKGAGRWSWGFTPARAMLETGGTYSYATDWLWGFYDLIVGQWKAIGGQGEPDLYGLPVRISLVYKSGTRDSGTWAAWLPQMEPDFDECGGTLQGWLAAKARAISEAGALLGGLPAIKALPIAGARETVDAVYEEIERPRSAT